ncbi:MAG: heme-binding domain-containing protein [Pirellulaceae bacterium]|nr:heme-binding domain-containing protein [Pirellulaceae bacterium]
MIRPCRWIAVFCLFLSAWPCLLSSAQAADLFRRENLVAWCIVPFDSQKRSPVQRAEMLEKLGIRALAYDYRAEHIPTFDDELDQLAKRNIQLTAWWFPTQLNDEARLILSVLEKHKVKTQLWVTGSGAATKSPDEQQARVEAEAARIKTIAQAAARQGCTVGLYNHGGWFGEPENQIAIIQRLKRDNITNVGIVYNQHHGHGHVTRFKELLAQMLPYLMVLNLNGMVPDGDTQGQKIVPLGAGSLDLELLRLVRDSGFTGPIGILNHTDHDALLRLQDNLDGLDWLLPQLDGKPAGKPIEYRTWKPAPKPSTSDTSSKTPSNLRPYDATVVKELASSAAAGQAERGVAVFASARTACLTCHKIGAYGGTVGPDLTEIGKQRTPEQLAESLLWPNQHVEDKYKVFQALTAEGQVVSGYKVRESNTELVLKDPSSGKETTLVKDDLENVRNTPSVMPEGLMAALSAPQQQDLVAFLSDLGHHRALRAEIAQSVLQHAQPHDPAKFPFDRAPLDTVSRYDWQAYVNRDRLYDFYTKEANHFRHPTPFEPLLAEYPGIDGGQQGHWGNQHEGSWESDAWNLTILGNLQAGVFRSQQLTVARAVCVRLGDQGQQAVCFDPDTLSYRAWWHGGFVKFSKVRHGFIHGMEPAGELLDLSPTAARTLAGAGVSSKYLGYYRVGNRIAFAYTIGDTEYLDCPGVEDGKFIREVAPRDQHSLNKHIRSLPPVAPETLTTQIKLGTAGPYAIDTIELPWDNPGKALIYCGDHDFLPDGSALVCTMQGDVWHVSGFSANADGTLPTQATWRRFATGLHHALGLRVSADGIFVLCRDQLTRLHDTNQDGVADWYECYSNAFETSPAGHDYICGLQRDRDGNFYIASGNQGLVRISQDGRRAQAIAAGFRNPDGLGIYPDGTITVPCSEGEWTPASMICAVPTSKWMSRLDKPVDLSELPFYGYRGSQYTKLPIARPELPLVYLPRGLDNSAGGQVYIDSQRWGPLAGNMIHLSFGTGSQFLLLRDQVQGQMQGAVVPLPGQFASGAHRGRFSPHDGQLYVTGMAGWGNYSTDRGCFQRVRYTGQGVQLPIGFHVHENGVLISFSQPLDRDFSQRATEHFAQCWNYRYSSAYGSSEYSALHYGMRGHDQLRVASAHVMPDGQSLFLELPDLQRCNQLHLQVATGPNQRHDLFATCNALDAPLTGIDSVRSEPRTLVAHPLDTDMAMAARRLPNPWRKMTKDARKIRIEAGKNLSYSTRRLTAKAGEPLALTLVNPDVVPHNWALIQPGMLQSVGSEANKLVADPEAVIRQYVPQTSDVICYTDVIEPQGEGTIYFKAPSQPGRYPFLCTFPGHWMVMNGELVVE